MKPVVTIILAILIAAVVLFFVLRPEADNPRVEQFVSCYIELAIFGEASDSVAAAFLPESDSILAAHGFDESSFLALKDSLDQSPEYLVDIWSEIETRLKDRQAKYEITE